MNTHFREQELSKDKDYTVKEIMYMQDGTLRVIVEKNGVEGYASDYLDRYRSYKGAENGLIKRALHDIEAQTEYFCEICGKSISKEIHEAGGIHNNCN